MEKPDISKIIPCLEDERMFEELQSELKKIGYYISKKPEPKIKLLPCTCGSKQIHIRRDGRKRACACGKCGRQTMYFGRNDKNIPEIEAMARKEWNKMIGNIRKWSLDDE